MMHGNLINVAGLGAANLILFEVLRQKTEAEAKTEAKTEEAKTEAKPKAKTKAKTPTKYKSQNQITKNGKSANRER